MTSKSNSAEIVPISIKKEMESSYLDYAMSVIVSRAIPDVRDGLKPVHRRIVYAMNESGAHSSKPYRKSARIVGDVMGKYHPHGDLAIYDALVRMAQDFSMSLPLIDGQGNFGSMDGDSPAAMRYTESRMAKSAHALIEDIDKDTVDWIPNYDGSEQEPRVLPSKFPNILVNGSSGIAVGMATNIPPHNLGEVCDATIHLIDNPEADLDELIQIVPGPDFPTGGVILGQNGSISALSTGHGSVIMRGKTEITEFKGKNVIVVHEIPYQVNKAAMIEKIAHLVRDKKLEGISDIRDESDKQGVRVVVELKRDANASVVLNHLFRYTPLQTSFGVNLLALDNGRPKRLNIKNVLESFITFRKEVITRRTKFELNKARNRAHILVGLSMAVANIDEVIAIIRGSSDPATAKIRLMQENWKAENVKALIDLVDDEQNVIIDGKCKFTEEQARAILEMRLSKLTGLEQEKIDEELKTLAAAISDYLDILANASRIATIIKDELSEVKEKFAVPRRTVIEPNESEDDIEDLIAREDMVVTVTLGGYIKRVPLSAYRAQRRGGKGRAGLNLKEEDVTTEVFVANTHTEMLFFSSKGKAYKLKTYRLPLGNPTSRGRALINVLPLDEDEKINVIMPLPDAEQVSWDEQNIVFATAKGNIRRNKLSDFESVRANGKIAISLDEDDSLVNVAVANDDEQILLATKHGKALLCNMDAVRVFKGRKSSGVRGITLLKDDNGESDKVISMQIIQSTEGESSVKKEYLRVPLENRMQISDILPSASSPNSSLNNIDKINININQNITAEILRNTGNDEVIAKIDSFITAVEAEIDVDTFINFARAEEFILSITENGYGKRTSSLDYRVTNRGGKGIINIITSERNGDVAACFPAFDGDEIILVTDKGKLIRCKVHDIRVAGRNTQGVTIFKIADGEKIVSAARIESSDDDEEGVGLDGEAVDNEFANEGGENASLNEDNTSGAD